eukprot:TRINITY_DN72467_c0_g1_i1.p1 TRINITY_DN72467_c0_g1~~TRINITY_DN72467_c0_g1_i1.p1  ORF type:complete len:449 (+),score=72.47 TRINITY_DN72467_c0_g1_i1:80-1348(+)
MPTFVKLFHSTASYGRVIPVPTRSNDHDVGVPALWTAVVPRDGMKTWTGKGSGTKAGSNDPCCKHHPRVVSLPQAQFVDWAGEDGESEWSLFFVNEQPGDNKRHTFFKYVLFCSSDGSSLLKTCKNWKRYEEVFSGVKPRELFRQLGQLWDQWGFGITKSGDTNHFHIGILGATAFSQYKDENETAWRHLRPDVPKVHAKEEGDGDGVQSEAESLTESEIFRRFAFENDEVDKGDGDWSVVKPKHKALDGCLPFCFEANRNIFPDYDGVFRHYCRAEAVWQCRRKTCTRKLTADLPKQDLDEDAVGSEPRTSWRSACCWYHEHLKDKETQGLRKGFERQYCGECWKKSKEWVEGQMCKFFKPGTFALDDDTGGRRGPHNPEICEVCHRLQEKGFDESCLKFGLYLAKGQVKVEPGATGWAWA